VFLEPSVNLAPRRRRTTRVQFVDPLEEDEEGEEGGVGGGGEGDRAPSPAPLHSAAFHHHLSSPPYGRFLASVADPGCLSRIRIFSIPDPNFSHPVSQIRNKEFQVF
jgi:hypothetical protein